ncbi:hypothetical protein BACCOP_00972, partial [Phocaeicola coprocola DSM 17136]
MPSPSRLLYYLLFIHRLCFGHHFLVALLFFFHTFILYSSIYLNHVVYSRRSGVLHPLLF